ncbi:MAG: hypothetical protein LUD39_01270 [Opitutae bacterium]|nr:hypothetical protein [Opitutae bacterium]
MLVERRLTLLLATNPTSTTNPSEIILTTNPTSTTNPNLLWVGGGDLALW